MFSLKKLITAAVLLGITTVITAFITINIPIINGAYMNIGDVIIFISVYALGIKYAPIIGGLGGMFADLILASPYFVFTLVVKALMAVTCALILGEKRTNDKPGMVKILIGMVSGGLVMIAGYFIADWYLSGSTQAAFASIIFNVIQAIISIIVAFTAIPFLKNIIKKTLWT